MITSTSNRVNTAVFALFVLASGLSQAAVPSEQTDTVGEATLVIGVVKAVGANGASRTLDRGTPVRVGDRIETGAGGHVHLRFVDGGRLSVRPSSRLQIENYNRNVEHPGLTAIKFRLDEGVVRSITGAWGEAARDRFRLNTPLAAIGVKGTDFVVKSDATATQATVYTGAIVLAPLSAACLSSLGPCANGSERLLSEDMKGQMLTLSSMQATPQLVASVEPLSQRARASSTETPETRSPVIAAGTANTGTTPSSASTASTAAGDKVATLDKTASTEIRAADLITSQAVAAVELAQRPTSEVKPILPPEVKSLVWARLFGIAAEGDLITRTHAQAKAAGLQSTVGNVAFTLYRDGAAATPLAAAETSANFRLAGSTATLIWDDRGTDVVDPARVTAGSLNVDFARASYSTQLSVASARIGTDTFSTSGTIGPNGFMQGNSNGVGTGGALSTNGREAAYFFERSYLQGQLRGVTLWGR